MDQKKIDKLRAVAYRTIAILREIEKGNRSPLLISLKAKCTTQLAMYYLKSVGVK